MKKLLIALGVFVSCLGVLILLLPVLMISAIVPSFQFSAGDRQSCITGETVATGGWTNPMAGTITSRFGPRSLRGAHDMHEGTDIADPAPGNSFYSASDGTVVAAYGTGGPEGNGDGGHGIIIDAGEGVQLWYWHGEAGSIKVRAGQKVTAGQELGKEGSTGNSTGDHLHFQVNVNGTPVDPEPFMKARGVTLGTGGPAPQNRTQETPNPVVEARSGDGLNELTTTTGAGQQVRLDKDQLRNLRTVFAAGKGRGMNDKALVIAGATVLAESAGYMYANRGVPESMHIPHQRVGSDHDSVGLFQQRPAAGWGSVRELMDARISTYKFFGINDRPGNHPPGLKQIPGWQNMTPGQAAQAVQVSAVPDGYDPWVKVSQEVLAKTGGGGGGSSEDSDDLCVTNTAVFTAGQARPGATEASRGKIIDAAKKGVGGKYVWGGTDFKAWDCSGYVQWAMTQAGIKGIPRTEQWTAGKKTTSPKPGDLVVQNPDGANHWAHVGIYAGDGMMYSALNPSQGTLLHPVSWGTESEYFTLIDSSK